MQQSHKQNLIENSAKSAKLTSLKKGTVRINGQVSIEPNKNDSVPIAPQKPARQNISTKREPATSNDNGHVNDKTTLLVANTNETTDEIEFLLEEIKDLEVPACRTDSEQDFEIAGSRVDLDLSLQLDSPIDTSWYYSSIILLEIALLQLLLLFVVQLSSIFVYSFLNLCLL